MMTIHSLLKLFSSSAICEITEYDNRFECKLIASQITVPSTEDLLTRVGDFPKRDLLEISISIFDTPNIFSSAIKGNAEDFLCRIKESVDIAKDEELGDIEIVVSIKKKVDAHSGAISIYSLSHFTNYLMSLDLIGVLRVLQKVLGGQPARLLEVSGLAAPFQAGAFHFVPHGSSTVAVDQSQLRAHALASRSEICNFLNATEFGFCPDDFELAAYSDNEDLNQLFLRLSCVFSIIYIFDLTSISGDLLTCKINGYKSLENEYVLDQIDHNSAEVYLAIYKWIYTEGNLSDKAGLARNIISISIKNGIFDIKQTVINSIRSGYEIYLKKNIQQYIEVKNQITSHVIDLSHRTNSFVYDLSNSFKQNVFAFITFFITVIVLNSISASNNGHIFTREISFISYTLIAISFIHLLFSVIEFRGKVNRHNCNYENLKMRYGDLIDENDLATIFNNDKEHIYDNKFLESQLSNYFIFWVITLFVFGTLVHQLTNS